MIVQQLF